MMGFDEVRSLYACARQRLDRKLERLSRLKGLRVSDFGTRRRHSFYWQEICAWRLREVLGPSCTGTSNMLLAFRNGLNPVGTNGHELPMVVAALADDDASLLHSNYKVLEDWRQLYSGRLLIVLPDTFGTRAFLKNAPEWVANWTGFRPDSAPPFDAGEKLIRWWKGHGRDPAEKLIIFSDALNTELIEQLHRHFSGRVKTAFGWGADLTNDFVGCAKDDKGFRPISLICKVVRANGCPAIKLSDNPKKATGDPDEIGRYLRVFGSEGFTEQTIRY